EKIFPGHYARSTRSSRNATDAEKVVERGSTAGRRCSMRLSEPKAATWLLKYFGCQNEALIGDLLEEYRQGRSAAWYWRQVLMAILVGCGGEVRANKLLAVRAVVTGWAASILGYYLITLPVYKLYWWATVTAGLRADRNEVWRSHY